MVNPSRTPRRVDLGAAGPLGRPAQLAVGVLLVVAPLQFLIAEALSASRWRGQAYDYRYNDISDLGVPDAGIIDGRLIDSPWHLLMNLALILMGLLTGIALLIGTRLLGPVAGWIIGVLAVVQAVGMAFVGIFHGGAAAQADGTILWHVLGALAAILCGNTSLVILGSLLLRAGQWRWFGILSIVLGGIGWLAYWTYMLAVPGMEHPPRGLLERGCVYTIIAWALIAGLGMLVAGRHGAASGADPRRTPGDATGALTAVGDAGLEPTTSSV